MHKDFLSRLPGALALALLVAAATGCGGSAAPTTAEQQLFAKADAICVEGREALEKVETNFPREGSDSLAHRIGYAEGVLAVSNRTAERLEALRPPEAIEEPYLEYVTSQKQIYFEDLTGAHAAHAVHPEEFAGARERRRQKQQAGRELAAELGLEACARPG